MGERAEFACLGRFLYPCSGIIIKNFNKNLPYLFAHVFIVKKKLLPGLKAVIQVPHAAGEGPQLRRVSAELARGLGRDYPHPALELPQEQISMEQRAALAFVQ